MNNRVLFFLVWFLPCGALSQYHENLMFGLKTGIGFNVLTNLPNVLITDDNKPVYSFSESTSVSPAVSVFSHYRFENSQIALEGRIGYSQLVRDVKKESLNTDAFERFNFNYSFLSLGLFAKVYLYRGLIVGVGGNLGSCLNSSSGIHYDSSFGSASYDLQNQEHISKALKGRANITACAIAAYEFKIGLSVEAGYYYGITDIIETNVNPYNFSESPNKVHSIQFSIGWAISKNGFYM